MEFKILKRQPMKLLALILFWGVLAAASLFFALQYWTDMRNLAYVKEYYACTGTLIGKETLKDGSGGDKGALLPIKKEAVEILAQSDYVSHLDIRQTRSAYAPELRNISSAFYSWDAGHLVIAEGTIDFIGKEIRENKYYINIILDDPVVCCAHSDMTEFRNCEGSRLPLDCSIPITEEFPLKKGDRILAVGCMSRSPVNGLTFPDMWCYFDVLPEYTEEYAVFSEELYPKFFTKLEKNATPEEVQTIIRDNGFEPFIKDAEILDHVFIIHITSNMNLLFAITQDEMFYTAGRGILPGDIGKKSVSSIRNWHTSMTCKLVILFRWDWRTGVTKQEIICPDILLWDGHLLCRMQMQKSMRLSVSVLLRSIIQLETPSNIPITEFLFHPKRTYRWQWRRPVPTPCLSRCRERTMTVSWTSLLLNWKSWAIPFG